MDAKDCWRQVVEKLCLVKFQLFKRKNWFRKKEKALPLRVMMGIAKDAAAELQVEGWVGLV